MTTSAGAPAAAVIPLVHPGMRCVVCTMAPERREAVETALATPASLRAIAGRFEIPRESLRRHLRLHLGPQVREHLERAERMSALNVAQRLVEIADAAKDIREATEDRIGALDAGPVTERSVREQRVQARLALRAGDSEAKTLDRITDRLGIGPRDALDRIADSQSILAAFGRVLRDHREFAEPLAAAFEEEGELAFAYSIRHLFDKEPTA